jgi:hypothetical protein
MLYTEYRHEDMMIDDTDGFLFRFEVQRVPELNAAFRFSVQSERRRT